eukprot:GHVL01012870.1.p1 GENE.GHVL01012870.1~~GHVL01012870.1.p1  ORF type:complete len:272 (+),score=51.49 GHVL01012870.1:46-861(+)
MKSCLLFFLFLYLADTANHLIPLQNIWSSDTSTTITKNTFKKFANEILQYSVLTKKNNKLKTKIRNLKTNLIELLAKYRPIQTKYEIVQAKLAELEADFEAFFGKDEVLQAKLAPLEADFEALNEKYKAATKEVSLAELVALEEEFKETFAKYTAALGKDEVLQAEFKALSAKYISALEKHRHLKDELAQLGDLVEDLHANHMADLEKKKLLMQKINDLKKRVTNLITIFNNAGNFLENQQRVTVEAMDLINSIMAISKKFRNRTKNFGKD